MMLRLLTYGVVFAAPVLVRAQTFADVVANNVFPVFDAIVGFIIAVTVVAFLFGVVRFMATSGNDQSRAAGKKMMVWGIVALFLMISVWGVVQIIKVTFFGA